MKIGLEVANARVLRGLSVRRLAEMSGVAHTQILRIERGESDPSVGVAERILAACGRHLVVSDGSDFPARLVANTLTAQEAFQRHRLEVAHIARAWGLRALRHVPIETPGLLADSAPASLIGSADEPVVFLAAPDPGTSAGSLAVLQGVLGDLLGRPVELITDADDDPFAVGLRPCAVPVETADGAMS